MSNVLIGIIGVILFIGLALAGALFLGPRFQEASLNSKAAAMVQAVSQVGDAVTLYNVQTGTPFQAVGGGGTTSALVSLGYLKAVPQNVVQGWTIDTASLSGQYSGAEARVVTTGLNADETGKAVCAAIAKQSGMDVNGLPPESATVPAQASGCYKISAQWGPISANALYMVYKRI